ncbi:hypothetical protein [Sphingomonas sp. Leaf242]|uniref:hypothetical protein n=1 Tax=Sphingomonas sp. Leaf242 TaxID=1736304 RepID=UPI0012E10E2C|nr:hypothetical protein [Sphingomonas sp. Leaf242]
MNLYNHSDWARFRDEVIKLDGQRCVRCSRGRSDDVVLQVHHKRYIPGRKPWEYAHSDCETLCKGCHAEEHGIIMPSSGWLLLATDDLGDLNGNCELCGTALRYSYAIVHPGWGSMAVGTDCCDKLTGTTDASEYHDMMLKDRGKVKRFVSSPSWRTLASGEESIIRAGIAVRISETEGKFYIGLGPACGKASHDSLIDAKIRALELIDTGEAANYLEKRRHKELARLRQRDAKKVEARLRAIERP